MNYSNIKYFDISNGAGVRTSIFVSGCTNHCKNCFNPETWDFNFGKPFTEETLNDILTSLDKYYIKGLSILGGDPMHPNNQKEVYNIVKSVKEKFPEKDIWLWTGYVKENIPKTEYTEGILNNLDYLIDGPFVDGLKDLTLDYRGSSNQRVIKMKED